jgi:hypothetical protein
LLHDRHRFFETEEPRETYKVEEKHSPDQDYLG